MTGDRAKRKMRGEGQIAAKPRRWGGLQWFLAAALVIAVFAAYQPAWQGGFIWDDDGHVTKPELRSWGGLCRIWFNLGATQQYYPLLHSVFWIEHKLWGDAPLGYHLVNILLHAVAALMAGAVLRRLEVPGAYLAAAIFALHPVQVESVAWITELKNTLSAVFYLATAMVYLRFDQLRKRSLYGGALLLFVLCLLSKTVTATLPAALLVIFWWQRGQLSWNRDVLPLAPFFVLGAAAGLFTAWVERTLIGAEGAAFDLTFVDRFLIAGRAIWFYLGKLFWPANLIFIYPRWDINQALWWQYLFPLTALLLVSVLWCLRSRCRGPLAGLLFFIGTLFPVLGFFNVFPFIYSFVADHFQYLASLGVIALVSAGIALLLERRPLWHRIGGYGLCLMLLSSLACMTWRQSRMYADVEKLYRTTIEKNPDCWMAYNNLGIISADKGRLSEAIEHYQEVIRINPRSSEGHNNLGNALLQIGKPREGVDHLEIALKIKPNYPEAHNNLGNYLIQAGQLSAAIEHIQQALRLYPDYSAAHNNLGIALVKAGRLSEAIEHYQHALKLDPSNAEAHNNLGKALFKEGHLQEAIEHFRQALTLKSNSLEVHNNIGIALIQTNRPEEAIEHFKQALNIKPDFINAYYRLATAYAKIGRVSDAIDTARKGQAIAQTTGQTEMAKQIEDWLNSYRASLRNDPNGRPTLKSTPLPP